MTVETIGFSLNPEHEIAKKYLECGNWNKTGLDAKTGKRALREVLLFHLKYCSEVPMNPKHEIVKRFLECGSWKKINIDNQEGKRAIMEALRFHFEHCLGIKGKNSINKTRAPRNEANSIIKTKKKPLTEKRKFRYSTEWRHIRMKRIENFGHICPITLKKEQIDVHHIDADWTNNSPDNLIPLWRPYHSLITARANYDEFYQVLDMTVLSSITQAWKEF